MDQLNNLNLVEDFIEINIPSEKQVYVQSMASVFYNPQRKYSRRLLSELVKRLKIRNYFDLCSGSGIRSIVAKKAFNLTEVYANDPQDEIKTVIESNFKSNNIRGLVSMKYAEQYAAVFTMNDLVDIDCFGSGIEILSSFLKLNRLNIKEGVYFLLFSSDLRVLCGLSSIRTFIRRYRAKSPGGRLANEIGLRILIKRILAIFSLNNLKISIEFAYQFEHYFQILVKTIRHQPIGSLLSKNAFYCRTCGSLSQRKSKPLFYCNNHTNIEVGPLFFGTISQRFNKLISKIYPSNLKILESNVIQFDYARFCRCTHSTMQSTKELKKLSSAVIGRGSENGFIRIKESQFSRLILILRQNFCNRSSY